MQTHDVASRRRSAICTDHDSTIELNGHDRGLNPWDMDDGLDARSSREEIVIVWRRSRTPRLTSPVLSLSMSMDSMLGYGFEKSDRCARAERELKWSVSRID